MRPGLDTIFGIQTTITPEQVEQINKLVQEFPGEVFIALDTKLIEQNKHLYIGAVNQSIGKAREVKKEEVPDGNHQNVS